MYTQPQIIQFANGTSIAVGDTFYYVSPELHDGTIETHIVESIWPPNSMFDKHGEKVRFIPDNKSCYHFVYKSFFERETPTCFIDYNEAQRQAEAQRSYYE